MTFRQKGEHFAAHVQSVDDACQRGRVRLQPLSRDELVADTSEAKRQRRDLTMHTCNATAFVIIPVCRSHRLQSLERRPRMVLRLVRQRNEDLTELLSRRSSRRVLSRRRCWP